MKGFLMKYCAVIGVLASGALLFLAILWLGIYHSFLFMWAFLWGGIPTIGISLYFKASRKWVCRKCGYAWTGCFASPSLCLYSSKYCPYPKSYPYECGGTLEGKKEMKNFWRKMLVLLWYSAAVFLFAAGPALTFAFGKSTPKASGFMLLWIPAVFMWLTPHFLYYTSRRIRND